MALVRVENLTVSYGPRVALRGISLELREGAVYGLMGESGSGKSTLARAIHGRLPRGAEVTGGRVWNAVATAYLPQEPIGSFSPYLTVGRQVADCLGGLGKSGQAMVEAELLRAGVREAKRVSNSDPHELSGGELQRAAWARALAQRPRLLLADEPTAALDSVLQREIVELVRSEIRQRQVTAVWISHDPLLLLSVSTRLIVMEAGEMVEEGPADTVWNAPGHATTAKLLEGTR